jgi:hypothetical protein
MDMHVRAPVPALPPKARKEAGHVAGVIERCLQKRPGDRFQSMDEVLDALM